VAAGCLFVAPIRSLAVPPTRDHTRRQVAGRSSGWSGGLWAAVRLLRGSMDVGKTARLGDDDWQKRWMDAVMRRPVQSSE